MSRLLRGLCLGVGAALAFASAARADLENENFLVSIPPGYKIDFQDKKGNLILSEMVPINESVKNWAEMVTVQIYLGLKVAPAQVRTRMEELWSKSCPGSETKLLSQEQARGYPSNMWVMLCPLNSQTGKPENTWLRAIQGADSFYVVQKAYKFTPSREQESKWIAFLQSASVCDSRVPEHACPKTKP
jgi:hypothetical protein